MKITLIFLLCSGVCAWPRIFGKMGPNKMMKVGTKRCLYLTGPILRTHFQVQRLKALENQRRNALRRSNRLQNQVLIYLARRHPKPEKQG